MHYVLTDKINSSTRICIRIRTGRILKVRIRTMRILTSFVTSLVLILTRQQTMTTSAAVTHSEYTARVNPTLKL